jgi:hypothetical protein
METQDNVKRSVVVECARERRKICVYDFLRFCLYPESKSCSVFDPVFGVSVCRLRCGGDFHAPRKVVDDVRPRFSKHLKGRSASLW